jgi:hypothetical protein
MMDLPAEAAQVGAEKFLAAVKEGLGRGAAGAKVTGDTPVKLGNVAGREFTLEMAGKGTAKSRVYVSGTKMYELTVGPVTAENEKDAKKFFDSFKIK